MRDLRTIAWREFRVTALTPAFLISLIAMPLVLVVVAVLSSGMALTHTEPPISGTIWIQSSEEFRTAFAERLKRGVDAESVGDLPLVTVNFEGAVAAGSRSEPPDAANPVLAMIPDSLLNPEDLKGEILLTLHDGLGRPQVDAIETALTDTVVQLRQRRAEVDPTLIDRLRTPPIMTTRIDEEGLTAEDAQSRKLRALVIPMGLMFLLWGKLRNQQPLMQTTLDEKANKVVEVLLSTTSPERLMMGKILGQSGVALTTVGIYGGLGISALIAAGKASLILDPQLLWPLAWFALAFLGPQPFWPRWARWCMTKGRLATSWAQLWLCLGFPSFSSCRSLKPLMEYPPALPHLPRSLVHTSWPCGVPEKFLSRFGNLVPVWCGTLPSPERFWWALDAFFGWESCPVAPHPS